MNISKDNIKKLKGGGDGLIVMMIGLYLIILAFFILLNAISESSEENYEKASNSLKTAFGFTSGEVEKNKEAVNITVQEFYTGISRKISGVISSYFPGEEFDPIAESSLMRISLPTYLYFDGDESSVNPLIYSFLYDITEILKNIEKGTSLYIEVNLNTALNPDSNTVGSSQSLSLSALRAAGITNILKNESVKLKSLNSSVVEGDEDMVNIYVRVVVSDYQKALTSYKDYLQE